MLPDQMSPPKPVRSFHSILQQERPCHPIAMSPYARHALHSSAISSARNSQSTDQIYRLFEYENSPPVSLRYILRQSKLCHPTTVSTYGRIEPRSYSKPLAR